MKNLINITLICCFLSCANKKDLIYLSQDKLDISEISNDYQLVLKPDDLLQINISSDDIESVLPFNLPIASTPLGRNMAAGQLQLQNYLIDRYGYIQFPVLGKLKLGGLTRSEAIQKIRNKLTPDYVKNPIVNIFITNFKVTVQGEVRNPGSFTFPNERVSLLDALGMAGDLTIQGNRSNVKVVREENNIKKIYLVDLRSKRLFNSEVYYLQQNDIIYVEPNNARIQDSIYTRNTGLFISLASVFISLLTIITR